MLHDCADVIPDGEFGRATESCVRRLQSANRLPVTGAVDSATFALLVDPMRRALGRIDPAGETFASLLAKYARQHAAQRPREVGGNNRGPWVRMYMGGFEGTDYPWGAAFVSFLVEQTASTFEVPNPLVSTFSFDQLGRSALTQRNGLGQVILMQPERDGRYRPGPGDIMMRRDGELSWNNGGIVVEPGSSQAGFTAIEGNTDDRDGESGDAVVVRDRVLTGYDFIRLRVLERSVLWVDDRPENNRSLITPLLELGIAVTAVTSTGDALSAMDRTTFDAVITDMGRPGNNLAGYELLDSIKARDLASPLPLIVYSTSTNIAERDAQVREAGGYGQVGTSRELIQLLIRLFTPEV